MPRRSSGVWGSTKQAPPRCVHGSTRAPGRRLCEPHRDLPHVRPADQSRSPATMPAWELEQSLGLGSREIRTRTCGCSIEPARNGSLDGMFDHVGIAVADLAASEHFYRTVLSLLGAEPSHADAELVEWEDWDIGATDREHPVTRGLHVGFRAPSREAVDAFGRRGSTRATATTARRSAHDLRPGLLRRLPARPGRQQRGGGAHEARGPVPTAASTTSGSACATPPRPSASTRRSPRTPGCGSAWTSRTTSRWSARTSASRGRRRAPAHRARPPRVPGAGRRDRAGVPRRRARRGLRGPRRSRRARSTTRATTARCPGPRRAQRRGRQPQSLSHGRRRRPRHVADQTFQTVASDRSNNVVELTDRAPVTPQR